VLENENGLREIRREPRRARHLTGEDLQVERKPVIRQRAEVPAKRRIVGKVRTPGETILLVIMPVQLHADAAQERIFGKPVERRADIFGEQIGIADDGMRPAAFVGCLLHPGNLFLGAIRSPVRLHVDGFLDARPGNVAQVFVDRIVAANRLVGTKNARQHRANEPRQIGLPPDVMMRVDNGNHA
jgi:hypothetical protein